MNKRQAKKKKRQEIIDTLCINFTIYGIGIGAVKGKPSKWAKGTCKKIERLMSAI